MNVRRAAAKPDNNSGRSRAAKIKWAGIGTIFAVLGMVGCSRIGVSGSPVTTAPGPLAARPQVPIQPHTGLPQDSAASAVSPNQLSARAALTLVKDERDKYWLVARHEVYKSALELAAQDQTEKMRGVYLDKVLRGPPGSRRIALTFDDGPHPNYTLKLLQILGQNKIHATFFVVGEKAEEYPDLVRAEVAAGDEIGNHTYDHVSLIKIPAGYVATEIRTCGDVIRSITGKTPTLFRPPGGEYNEDVVHQAQALGYRMILYSDDPGDYAQPGTGLIETRTLDTIGDGGIILLHDGSQQTLTVLPTLISRLKARGFQFVTVSQMLDTH
ncbi:MAG: polysaccharide deacetylase family protein [Janthinobacterium lividum]